MQALAEGKPLADVLATDPDVIRCCSKTDIAALLNPDTYTGTAVQQVERLIKKLSPLCT
jgi:adenylosuccinate lyase